MRAVARAGSPVEAGYLKWRCVQISRAAGEPPRRGNSSRPAPFSNAEKPSPAPPGPEASGPVVTPPFQYDANGTKTRPKRGNPAKITRSQFGKIERYQFGAQQLARALKVSADELLGLENPRKTGPSGKVRRVFEAVTHLPRRQQQRIVEVVEDMLTAQKAKAS